MMFEKIVITLLLFQFLITATFAQNTAIEKPLKQAEKKLASKKYSETIKVLEDIVAIDSTQPKVWFQLGEVHLIIRDYIAAKTHFQKAYLLAKNTLPVAGYRYAQTLKLNGDYNGAIKVYEEFIANYKQQDNFIAYAKTDLKGCEMALAREEKENDEALVVKHLSNNINSKFSEMAPVFWDDSTLLYASLPLDTIVLFSGKKETDFYIKFFLADFKADSFFNALKIDDFTVPNANITSGCLSTNRLKFYFTACAEYGGGSSNCQIYVSEFKFGKWNEPERVESPLNDYNYNNYHPTISSYKKGKEIMYFTSDRPGGKGGKDIWFSIIDANGSFSAPQNAGNINTSRDEITPYYDNLNGLLYFSSEGHVGYGGLDVFKATGEKNVFTDIENVDLPINSNVDDLYFSFLPSKNIGLLVSNRSEQNVAGSTCCDDIFYVKYTKPKKLAIMGFVKDADLAKNYELSNARVSLSLIDSSGNNLLLKEKTTLNNEPFYFILKPEQQYVLSIGREGYFNKTVSFNTIGKAAPDTIRFDVLLDKIIEEKTYRLSSIYYAFNDFNLLPEAKATLDTLFEVLEENPEIKIELSSHTDSRGTESYNLTLSQKRAQSCVSYLISKGISSSRLIAKGYGSQQPLQDCSNDDNCTKEEDCACYQMNRRTEFRVVR
jgi:outer membrane protein OmpA-like peptidoglycan-associated protein